MNRLILFLWLCCTGVACTTSYPVTVQTLRPAEIYFPQGAGEKVALLAREGYLLSTDHKTERDKEDIDTMMLTTLHGLADVLSRQPLYGSSDFLVDKRSYEGFPGRSDYAALFKEYPVDQIILVDSVYLTDEMTRSEQFGVSYVVYHIQATLRWNVLFRDTPEIRDVWMSRDTLRWVGAGFQMREALVSLPSRGDALWDMGLEIAKNYGSRISPFWITEDRTLICSGSLSHLARVEFENGNLSESVRIWSELQERSRSPKKRAFLMNNLAVAAESLDDLSTAEEWIEEALGLLDASSGRSASPAVQQRLQDITRYAERIRLRMEERRKLEDQIFPD